MADFVNVKVKLYAFLRDILKSREIDIEIDKDKSTVFGALEKLNEMTKGLLFEVILDSEGNLKENYAVLVNGKTVPREALTKSKIKDGDVLVIFPPTSGGLALLT